jgi:hypothetical protein
MGHGLCDDLPDWTWDDQNDLVRRSPTLGYLFLDSSTHTGDILNGQPEQFQHFHGLSLGLLGGDRQGLQTTQQNLHNTMSGHGASTSSAFDEVTSYMNIHPIQPAQSRRYNQ